jgi:predicted RNA methylase
MRIAGQMRLGYYPADPGLATRLARLISWPVDKPVAVLDPCCGCGEALAAFAGVGGARTYGIELARNRAEVAAGVLGSVLNAGFETTRMTERSFSACWLNPPYDDELGGGKRTELEFVQRVSPLLAEGGVLVFFMAGRASNSRMHSYLTSYYENLRRFRHPPTERNGYAQAAVEIWIGQRRRMQGPAGSWIPDEDLPGEGQTLWTAPPCRPLRTFEKWGYTDEELAELAGRSSAWSTDGGGPIALGRPLLPLKLGHIPMVLASGRLNGCIGDHLARARVEKEFETVEVRTHVDDKGRVTGSSEVQREKIKLSIRCLARKDGEARVYDFA